MSINNISAINENAAANATASAAAAARTNVGADQTTFLKLLIAQMKHQDPLSPQDSTQYIAQLAQFSSLEQLTSINNKLGQLLDLGNK
jgi:flagellar basal-body rod modification protein FlgD